ncbi:MAG: hypothetical protein JST16_12645 [Bdellovibrionales bacterium]|nr:hypothetical protein [Bdellovibrionales bacterium]
MLNSKIALAFSILASASAFALAPLKEGSKAMDMANVANRIFQVHTLRTDGAVYKVVEMDSILNGDLNSTVIVLVGEQEVGGAAAFEAAYQVGPEPINRLVDARVVGDHIELKGYTGLDESKPKKFSLKFNAATKDLAIH